MHFICGGAFQGKRKWVKAFYQLDDKEHTWFNGYEERVFPTFNAAHGIVVIEGIEMMIHSSIKESYEQVRQEFQHILKQWDDWLLSCEHNELIIIGSDIGMGVVPLEKEERVWRDIVGWCYQDIVKRASRVDKIWCGLAEQLK